MVKKALPNDLPGRLSAVGRGLYGRHFRARLAAGLNIGRATLHGWMTGAWETPRDIEAELIALVDTERAACAERGIALTAIRQERMAGR